MRSYDHDIASQTPAEPADDDLKRIRGVGPGIERRMQAAGLRTFAGLAALSPAELAAQVALPHGMSPRRIADEDWIGQARALAQAAMPLPEAQQPAPLAAEPPARLRANFTAELLLSQAGAVRGTRVAHVQSGAQEAWAGWDERKLIDFFTRSARLELPNAQPAPVAAPAPEPPEAPALRLLDCVVLSAGAPRRVVGADQPFELALALELGEMAERGPLAYALSVQARRFGGPSSTLAERDGLLRPGEPARLVLSELRLPAGMYRLDATVALGPGQAGDPAPSGPRALLEGGLLQVY